MIDISVFIIYGKDNGRHIGNRLRTYLNNVGLNTLIASPERGDFISGQDMSIIDDFKILRQSDVVVVIATEGLRGSKGEEEVKYLFDNNLQSKIVCFTSADAYLLECLNRIWRPVHFPPEMPEETFCRLQAEILKNYILRIRTPIPKTGLEKEAINYIS